MKKMLFIAILVSLSISNLSGEKYSKATLCKPEFEYDPCPLGSYTIVETEKFVRGRHNWMKVGDTLDTDIITGGVGAEKRRNLPREAYFSNSSIQPTIVVYPSTYHKSSHKSLNPKRYEDQHPRVVKSDCDTPNECRN